MDSLSILTRPNPVSTDQPRWWLASRGGPEWANPLDAVLWLVSSRADYGLAASAFELWGSLCLHVRRPAIMLERPHGETTWRDRWERPRDEEVVFYQARRTDTRSQVSHCPT